MFYLLCIFIVLYNLLLYVIFRGGIYNYLRLSRVSKNNIKKNRNGLKNYWLYYSINKQKPLGTLYYLNIIFLFYTIGFSVFSVALGYIKALQPFVLILSVPLCIIEIPVAILASRYNYQAEFGRPFVLLARSKLTKRFCSSLIDMFSWIITALLICFAFMQL